MLVSARQVGVAQVVALSGRATGEDNHQLRETMARLDAEGHRRIVLDLGELEYLDSSALGELVACQVRAIRIGAALKLANPEQRIQDLLLLTRLTTVFETFPTVAAAIESFDDS